MKTNALLRLIKKIVVGFFKFIISWNEVISLPIAIVLFVFIVPLLRSLDPTTISYDYGVFQKPLLVIIYFFFYHAVAWFLLRVTFPKVYHFLEKVFDDEFKSNNSDITEWRRAQISLSLFFFYLFCIVLVSLTA